MYNRTEISPNMLLVGFFFYTNHLLRYLFFFFLIINLLSLKLLELTFRYWIKYICLIVKKSKNRPIAQYRLPIFKVAYLSSRGIAIKADFLFSPWYICHLPACDWNHLNNGA
jgi:hypothetical protein